MKAKINLASVYKTSGDIVSRDIDGELLVMPSASEIEAAEEDMFTLNETAQAIWEQLDGQRSLKEVAQSLAEEYDAPVEVIEEDILGFTKELLERGIIIEITGA